MIADNEEVIAKATKELKELRAESAKEAESVYVAGLRIAELAAKS
jgi:hypothetical protein